MGTQAVAQSNHKVRAGDSLGFRVLNGRTTMMEISKKPKRDSKTPPVEDWISSLPDCLLHHILSLLKFKEVVATSALAERWRFLWRSVPVLDLRSDEWDYGYPPHPDILTLICQTLEQYKGPKIREFYARFCYEDLTEHQIDFWVQFATERNVEVFDLNLFDYTSGYDEETVYNMLPCLLDCQSLKVLRLASCDLKLNPQSSLNLSLLKELVLHHVPLPVLDTSGCPILETLILKMCVTPPEFGICAPSESLRYLMIYEDSGVTDCYSTVRLFAPNLQCIHLSGFIRRSYSITNVSSLRSAKLDFNRMNEECDLSDDTASLLMLLKYLSHASYLRLCLWCIQALSFGEVQGWRCPPFKARCLKLQSNLEKYELGGMAAALRGCRYLESLIIDTSGLQIMSSVGESNDTWEILKYTLSTSNRRLRYVKIKNFLASGYDSLSSSEEQKHSLNIDGNLEIWDKEFQFVELLLNSCALLEMMTISTIKWMPTKWTLKPELIIALTKRLLNLPRASANARIHLS